MKGLFLNALKIFCINRLKKNRNSSLGNVSMAMLSKDALNYKLSETSVGFFNEVFENLTTSVRFI